MDKRVIFCNDAGAVTSAQMKEIEKRADESGLSYYQMMENAGTGVAEYIAMASPARGKKILIFCGKGNNGGDGFVAARKLAEMGASVKLFLVEGEPKTTDAIANKRICVERKLTLIDPQEELQTIASAEPEDLTTEWANVITGWPDLIIDAIYGTGFHGEMKDPVRKMTQLINRSRAAVYALDIPSGLNGDTGEADEDTVRADSTIAFHRLKPAHLDESCAGFCGKTVCISIGIEEVVK